MEKTIKAYMLRVNAEGNPCRGYIGEIDNTLKAKQEFVGGTIQVIMISPEINAILNDDGKLLHLPINRLWKNADGEALDFVVGNILLCRNDDDGNFTSILERDIELIEKCLIPLKGMSEVDNRLVFYTCPEQYLPEYKDGGEK